MAKDNIAMDWREVEDDLYFNPITGDFDVSPSDNQHIEDLLNSPPGSYKDFPLATITLVPLLKGKLTAPKAESIMKQTLENDGYSVGRPQVSSDSVGNFIIKPNAKRLPF